MLSLGWSLDLVLEVRGCDLPQQTMEQDDKGCDSMLADREMELDLYLLMMARLCFMLLEHTDSITHVAVS